MKPIFNPAEEPPGRKSKKKGSWGGIEKETNL